MAEKAAEKPAGEAPMVHPSNWVSDVLMWYLNPLLRLGASRPLEPSDLGTVLDHDKSTYLTAEFLKHWAVEKQRAARLNAEAEAGSKKQGGIPQQPAPSDTISAGLRTTIENPMQRANVHHASAAASGADASGADGAGQVGQHHGAGGPDKAGHAGPQAGSKGPAKAKPSVRLHKPSMNRALVRTIGYEWVWAIVIYFVSSGLGFLPPIILQRLVNHLEGREVLDTTMAWLHVGGMLVLPLLAALLASYHNNVMARVGTQIRTALMGAIYAKSLVLRNTGEFTTGEVVQRMSVDAALPLRFVTFASNVLVAPPTVAVALWLIYRYVGVSTFAGLGFLLVATPLSGIMVKTLFGLRIQAMRTADRRVKLTNEVLTGIRIVKFYAWEKPLQAMIDTIREQELALNYKGSMIMQVNLSLLMLSLPIALPVIVFSVYASLGNGLDAGLVFATISLFAIMRQPLAFLPMGLTMWSQFQISLDRIAALLLAPEMDPSEDFGADLETARATPIMIETADFRWDTAEPPKPASSGAGGPPGMGMGGPPGGGRGGRGGGRGGGAGRGGGGRGGHGGGRGKDAAPKPDPSTRPLSLQGINLSIRAGELLAIVGPVASGKSSLLSAMLGELPIVKGRVRRAGHVAYASQQPWVVNASLRDNILFGRHYDADRYQAVLEACAMLPDLQMLPNGDETEVGEKGVTLSGGQKARVCLARAAYAAEDMCAVIMDDPLAAVDAHVGAHLFSRCIGNDGFLRGTTRVLVTNALHVLPHCDRVVVMGTGPGGVGGLVKAIGSYSDLMATQPELMDSLSALAGGNSSVPAARPTLQDGAAAEGAAASAAATGAAGPVAGAGQAGPAAAAEAPKPDATVPAVHLEKVLVAVPARDTPANAQDAVATKPADGPLANGSKAASSPTNGSSVVNGSKIATSPTNGSSVANGSKAGAGKLMSSEERATGQVSGAVIWAYVRANGAWPVMWTMVFTVGSQALALAGNFWISDWATASVKAAYTRTHVDNFWYLYVYVGLGLAAVAATTIRGVFLVHGRVNSSRYLHGLVLKRVLSAPVFFFDTTPLGRILNRFSRDIYTVDNELPMSTGQTLNNSFQVLATLVSIAVSTKGILIGPLMPLIGLYMWIQGYFRKSNTEIQRLESLARSPIYSGFSLALSGVSTIRAYGVQQRYVTEAATAVDNNTVPYLLSQLAGNWLTLWTSVLSGVVAFLVACIAVGGRSTDLISPAWTALALSAALELAGSLAQAVKMYAQWEAQLNSVERLVHYGRVVPSEAPWETHQVSQGGKAGSASKQLALQDKPINDTAPAAVGLPSSVPSLPAEWPARGEVVVKDLRLRYGRTAKAPAGNALAGLAGPAEAGASATAGGDTPVPPSPVAAPPASANTSTLLTDQEGLDLEAGDLGLRFPPLTAGNRNTFQLGDEVLHGISFSVPAGSKLGIVGRTGSGKSSLAIALFRIVEPVAGSVLLDGVDTATVPLQTLRARLSIIPQDPVLFSTTIRNNVDPLGRHSDSELTDALSQVRLGHYALDAPVAEGGSNLSVGERQLLCIARALLRQSSVIVFDEATASIDSATDAFVQTAIRQLFASATVLTIAHRLATVADADAILVLDKGHVAEFGPPAELLRLSAASPSFEAMGTPGVAVSGAQPGSFRALVDRLGPEAAAEVERIALEKAGRQAPASA